MADLARLWRPAAWFFYVVLVFEILFMISPAALYFYSVYGPALNFLQQWPATTWLTQFFLPHISVTGNPLLDHLGAAGGLLVALGAVIFLAAAIPLYAAKLRRRGAVTGGLYRYVRHPQYLGLAVMGLGTTLIWPRFLVLLAFVAMLFLYVLLARWEEAQCIARFGDPYRAYLARTGRFLPRLLPLRRPSLLPAAGAARAAAMLVLFAATMAATVAGAMALRGYSLGQVAGLYRDDLAVISPARLSRDELEEAYRLASADPRVKARLGAAPAPRLVVHVVSEAANLPDLPIDALPARGGHHVPRNVDRTRLKVLFSRPRSHAVAPAGRDIVRTAHGLDPIVVARLDLAKKAVTGVTPPPAHVRWGDIPTPLF
jgi:protein-S-isoprenylcysteine O-methyltransferase Ste14